MSDNYVVYVDDPRYPGDDTRKIKLSVQYQNQSFHAPSHSHTPKGYYAMVQPMVVKGYTESFMAFTGFFDCLVECDRRSKKKKLEANKLLVLRKQVYIDAISKREIE